MQHTDNGGWLARLLGRHKGSARSPRELVDRAIDKPAVRTVYQPLVDMKTHRTFAYEALARCDIDELKAPPVLFEAAQQAGRVGELGRLLRQQAVDSCTGYPLFLNIHPHEFDAHWLVRPDDPMFWHGETVYLEITESVPIHYFEQCHGVLAEVRSKGIKLAVDDLGSGFSNLKYIADLVPEVVKIDRELIAGVLAGSRQHKLIRNIVRMCEDLGAKVVAEGIETEDEMLVALEAGAHYGQGYLFARPAFPAPRPVWPGEPPPPPDDAAVVTGP